MGGSQTRGDRTRDAIIEQAVRCVIEEGFAAASAQHIAERAGVTWGVIQYHFGDRAGVLAAVIDAGFDELRSYVAAIVAPEGTTRERVEAIVEAAWAAFSAPTSRASFEILIATRGSRERDADRHLRAMGAELTQLGADLINGSRTVEDSTAVGELLWASLRGMVFTHMIVARPWSTRHGDDLRRARKALVDVLVCYLER